MSEPESSVLTETALHYLHCGSISADDAIQCCQAFLATDQAAFGLLYSPDKCRLIKITDAAIESAPNTASGFQTVFELRVFNETLEMRWLHENSGSGRAVIVSEVEVAPPSKGEWTPQSLLGVEPQASHSYQLWGKALSEANGWTVLTDAQIGELRVPLTGLNTDQRVAVTAVEYLGVADDDGNMIVSEERLTGLKAIENKSGER